MATEVRNHTSAEAMTALEEVFAQTMPSTMGYDYLGNWIDRPGNANIEPDLLRGWLQKQGVEDGLVGKALHILTKEASDTSKHLYDRNKDVYRLLRYGANEELAANVARLKSAQKSLVETTDVAARIRFLPPSQANDELFFVDLPDLEARHEILALHLRKRGRNPDRYEVGAIAELCANFSGAELEQVVVGALHRAFALKRELEGKGLHVFAVRAARRGMRRSLFSFRERIEPVEFLVFNQQFVTLVRAGLPILKGLDLLADAPARAGEWLNLTTTDGRTLRVAGGIEAKRAAKALKEISTATGGEAYFPKSLDEVDPELFLLLFIPPLLFVDAWSLPRRDFMRVLRPVLLLALGLVVLTVVAVGYFLHWLIPTMPLAVAMKMKWPSSNSLTGRMAVTFSSPSSLSRLTIGLPRLVRPPCGTS